jgi:superfamily II DNA or RNA helicase
MAKTTGSLSKSKDKKKTKKAAKVAKVSYHRRPEDMTLDLWQLGLRKQFGEENSFQVTKNGGGGLSGQYEVWNPTTRNAYEVHIRTALPKKGLPLPNTLTFMGNTCSCQDFKTNRLGLCKHISATLHHIGKKRGGKSALRKPLEEETAAIYVDYWEMPRLRIYIGTRDRALLSDWYPKWFDREGYILPQGVAHFDQVVAEARAIQPDIRCLPEAIDQIAEQRDTMHRQKRLAQIMPLGEDSPYLDKLLKVKMFPYQRQGVWFAANAGRCMIADEMGLGKTIQAIAAAEILRRELGVQKAIVVCPTSLKYQWKMEIEKFTDTPVNVVEGLQTKRIHQYENHEAFFQIVSYNAMANDASHLAKTKPDLLIIDEAQRIKNFRTKVSMQLKKIESPYRFVLTGTPLENKLEELYAITQFVNQHKLPPLYRFLDRYQILGENGQVKGYQNLKEIGATLSDCLIRRLKKDVLKQLPKRMDKVLFVPMTQQQKDIHRDLADGVARLVAKWRRFHFLNETDRRKLILCLSQMRMVADSTFILDQKTRFDTKIDELMCIFEEALADADQKVVIFSQWERMTRLVAQELDARSTGYAYLHGGVPGIQRADLLERFQNDPECRVFLSTDAGGVGLNLQNASLLINLDVPWNPAILEQRVGRIYRMGQKNNVRVINMVSGDSIEHRMLDILKFKSSMAQGVLDPDGDDTIFMSESKFKQFMDSVETLTEAPHWHQAGVSSSDAADEMSESEDYETPPQPSVPSRQADHPAKEKPVVAPSFEDDDVPEPVSAKPAAAAVEPQPTPPDNQTDAPQHEPESGKEKPSGPLAAPSATTLPPEHPGTAPSRSEATHRPASAPQTPGELIQTGVSFFSGLAQTLSSPEKTRELVQSIVAKDEQTGQTYLKIPVENAAVVENAVKLLGGLLAGLGR